MSIIILHVDKEVVHRNGHFYWLEKYEQYWLSGNKILVVDYGLRITYVGIDKKYSTRDSFFINKMELIKSTRPEIVFLSIKSAQIEWTKLVQ